MIDHRSIFPMLRAGLVMASATAALTACADHPNPDRGGSTASMAPDLAGNGGPMDQIYRQIYSPGDPWWSQL